MMTDVHCKAPDQSLRILADRPDTGLDVDVVEIGETSLLGYLAASRQIEGHPYASCARLDGRLPIVGPVPRPGVSLRQDGGDAVWEGVAVRVNAEAGTLTGRVGMKV